MLSNIKLFVNCYKYFPQSSSLSRKCSSLNSSYTIPSKSDEYTLTPNYPSAVNKGDYFLEEIKLKEASDKIKRQKTVEEKLFVVNVPRYWGWKCFMVHEGVIPFNNLHFTQHMTRTHIIRTDKLPCHYENSLELCSAIANKIKQRVLDSIEYQLHVRHKHLDQELEEIQREKEITKIIISELNRVILSSIGPELMHVKSLQTDFTPRIEASWEVNSLTETVVHKENKYGIPLNELPEEYLGRPSDKFIQYIGKPILQLRHQHPLPSLISRKESDIFSYSVPVFEYDPHTVLGYEMNRRHVTNIPGFWPGDDREFSFLSYHCLNHIKFRPPTYGDADTQQAIQSQILFASFGWLMSLACYQGFSVYNDLTYPIVSQTVATDGRLFAIAAYQLNTIATHFKNPFENPKCNICWITPTVPLFEEYVSGKLKGFNEVALQMLLQLYVNRPEPMENVNYKPYLGEDVKLVADYEDDEKREWLEKSYKHFAANKPPGRPDLMYEVQDWERIYKIQFRMRPQDARKRPFELRQNPYQLSMCDMAGKYIPKALRPDKHLPRWRQKKHSPTFYPQ